MEKYDLIKKNTMKLKCGSLEGTAFLIGDDKAVTCRHCVEAYFSNQETIELYSTNLDEKQEFRTTAEVMEEKTSCPIVILRLSESVCTIEHPELVRLKGRLKRGQRLYAYGYPAARGCQGCIMDLTFAEDNIGLRIHDADWSLEPVSKLTEYKGASGSALMLDQKKVLGVLDAEDKDGKVAFLVNAVSNGSISSYWSEHDISLKELDYDNYLKQRNQYDRMTGEAAAGTEMECIFPNDNRNAVIKSAMPKELLDELTSLYQEKLEKIGQMRLEGKEIEAWKTLREAIGKLQAGAICNKKIVARFYYYQAICYLEDKEDGKNAQKYFQKAVEADPEIDTRTYIAKKRFLEGTCSNVLELLHPLDTTAVLNTYLQLCVYMQECEKAIFAFKEATVAFDYNTYYMMALIYTMKHNLVQAEQLINQALEEKPDVILYQMMKGVILYQKVIPEDLQREFDLLPAVFETGVVYLSKEDLTGIEHAVSCYKKALELARIANNERLQKLILTVWLDTLSVSGQFADESVKVINQLEKLDDYDAETIIWKCRNNGSVESYQYEELETRIINADVKLGFMIALVELCLSKGDSQSARKYLLKYRYEFNRLGKLEWWYELRIRAAVDIDDIDCVSEDLGPSQVKDEYKKRLAAMILQKKNSGAELFDYARELYQESGKRLDLINLIRVCEKYEYWAELEKYAAILWESFGDESARKYVAKSQLMQHKVAECIEEISAIEENTDIGPELQFYKVQALKLNYQYEKAISEGKKLWDKSKGEGILLLLSECYFLSGQESDAVSCLKEGSRNGISTVNVYRRMAEILSIDSPREVKKYVKKACIAGDNSEEIMSWAIQMLFQVGESAEASEMLSVYMMKNCQAQKRTFKQCSVKEALQIIEDGRRRQEKLIEMYLNCEIPYHIMIDSQMNASFAVLFHRNWEKNNFLYMMYGGRYWQEEKAISYNQKGIVLDYSSCVFLYELGLLRDVAEAFGRIWLDGNIFRVIACERHFAQMQQPDLVLKRREIMQLCKNIKIVMHEVPDEAAIMEYQKYKLQLSDTIYYREAKECGLLWIEEILGTELLEGTDSVPPEVKRAAIKPLEFLTFLYRKALISRETLEKYDGREEELREDVISGMIQNSGKKPRVLIDFSFMEELYNLNCLEHIAEVCELHAFSFVFDDVKEEGESLELTQRIQNILTGLEDTIRELKEMRQVTFIPYIEMDHSVTVGVHTYQLKELMSYAAKEDIPLVCDDRMVNSYEMAGKEAIFTSADVIEYLHAEGHITKEVYMRTVKMLLDKNVCYVVPSYEFMKNALLQEAEEENSYLVSVRRYLQRILNPESQIRQTCVKHQRLPEAMAYMLHLQNTCMHLLGFVWKQEKELSWKERASQWLLHYFSEFGFEFLPGEGNPEKLSEYRAVRLAEFICNGIFEVTENSNRKQYFAWMFEWVGSFLAVNPHMEERVIKSFSTLLYAFFEENTKKDKLMKDVALVMLAEAINVMPDSLKEAVLNDPYVSSMITRCETEILVLDKKNSITKEEFMRWAGNAVDAGLRQPVIKRWKKNEYKIVFYQDGAFAQKFLLYWDNNKKYTEISDPQGYLYSHWSKNRIKGLERIRRYLTEDEYKRYESELKAGGNKELIESIRERLDTDYRYWKDGLRYTLSRQNRSSFGLAEVFPKSAKVFEETLPVYEEETWLSEIRMRFGEKELFDTLNILVKLPLGGKNSFVEAAEILAREEQPDSVFNWCNEKLKNSHNPVELFNVLLYWKRKEKNSETEETLFRLLEEDASEAALFIELLRVAYAQMERLPEYENMELKEKYLYSYLFAGTLQEVIYDLNAQNNLYGTIADYSRWTIETNDILYVEPGAFIGDPEGDISSPKQISSISLTYVSVCNFLLREQYMIQDREKMKKLLFDLLDGDWKDSKSFAEGLLSDERRSNIFNTMFCGNLFQLCDKVMKQYNIGNVKQTAFLNPVSPLNELASKEFLDVNELAYLYIVSHDKIHEEWIPAMEQIVQNFHITQSEVNMGGKFKCIATVLEQCPEDFIQAQTARFEQELRERFRQNKAEDFDENFMMLEKLCVLKNRKKPFVVCLDFLEDITKEQPLNITGKFADMFVGLRFRVETEIWERAKLLVYQFRW